MLDLIAAGILMISLIVLAYAEYRRDRRPTPKKLPSVERGALAATRDVVGEEKEMMRSMPEVAPPSPPESRMKSKKAVYDEEEVPRMREELARPAPPPSAAAPSPAPLLRPEPAGVIERKASIVYWERMCLKEEFDLIVWLHKLDVVIVGPDGSTTKVSDTVYKLPKNGQVRVVPVCSACNISPAFRDIKVEEIDSETKAEFKVLPLSAGKFDLTVEFQFVGPDGSIRSLGMEKVTVTIQEKPIHLNIGGRHPGVGRKVPTYLSMCGSLFGFSSFVFARFGVNIEEQLIAWSATVSTGLVGAMMILLAILLLARGIKPVMTIADIILKAR